MKAWLLFLLLSFSIQASAADSLKLIASRPLSARFITTDNLGNTYAILNDNTITRYNNKGDSTGYYHSALNGDMEFIDATNPLRILIYYPSFNTVALLDNQLALKTEIDLSKLNILTPTAVAIASDGNLWVYDPVNAILLKLDENGNTVTAGIDLRQQLSFVPNASSLLEKDRRIYLCDTAQGILIFDQFATYMSTLPFKGIPRIQAFDQQILFMHQDSLHNYNMQSFQERQFGIPEPKVGIIQARLNPGLLTVLYSNHLAFYAWNNGQ